MIGIGMPTSQSKMPFIAKPFLLKMQYLFENVWAVKQFLKAPYADPR
jgi:hypothetical protein